MLMSTMQIQHKEKCLMCANNEHTLALKKTEFSAKTCGQHGKIDVLTEGRKLKAMYIMFSFRLRP